MNPGKSATFSRRALNADLDPTLMQHTPLVRCLAHQMIAKLAASVEIDDLINVGMIGLADALSRFDVAQDVQFENFATTRIRGVMLDELILADEEIQRDRAIGRRSNCQGVELRCEAWPSRLSSGSGSTDIQRSPPSSGLSYLRIS